jgi:hypothetical protein
MIFSFGRRRKGVKKGPKKPPARLIKMCKKYRIKCTRKVGKRRVYKSVSVLKKQLRKRMKKSSFGKRKKKSSFGKRKRRVKRRFGFGNAAAFVQPSNYGYNQKVEQAQGILSQSSQVVTPANNINRPPEFGVDPGSLPTYGVYRPFFTEQVPTQIGPKSIGFMGQPDGSFFQVGGPVSRYTSFGKKRRGRKVN